MSTGATVRRLGGDGHDGPAVRPPCFLIRTAQREGDSGREDRDCAQLAAKFWEPDSGRILCSGKDIAGFSEESWLAHVSIVFQE